MTLGSLARTDAVTVTQQQSKADVVAAPPEQNPMPDHAQVHYTLGLVRIVSKHCAAATMPLVLRHGASNSKRSVRSNGVGRIWHAAMCV